MPCGPASDGVIVVRKTRFPAARASSANRTSPSTTSGPLRPAAMSLVPMCSTTSVAPGTSATSRPIRTSGESPPTCPRSASSSLREIPALSTAIVAAPPRRARRSDSASDQRESVSSPLPTPSVIESPIATSALTGRGARTSTPVSTIHDPTGVANAAPSASREKSPEPER